MIIIQNAYGDIIMSHLNSVEQALKIAKKIHKGETSYPPQDKRQSPYMVYDCTLKCVVGEGD